MVLPLSTLLLVVHAKARSRGGLRRLYPMGRGGRQIVGADCERLGLHVLALLLCVSRGGAENCRGVRRTATEFHAEAAENGNCFEGAGARSLRHTAKVSRLTDEEVCPPGGASRRRSLR